MVRTNRRRRARSVVIPVSMLAWLVLVTGFAAGQEADARRRQDTLREGWQRVPEILVAVGAVPGGRLADVGAGDGFFTVRLARAVGAGGHVTAVDVDASALERLRRRLSDEGIANVDVVRSDSADADLGDASLDGILIVNAYHEMERYQQTLARLRRALKPGGRLVLVEPLDSSLRAELRGRQTRSHSLGAGFAVTELRAAGFSIINLQDPFVSRGGATEEWMLVAERRGGVAAATGAGRPGAAPPPEPPAVGAELEDVGSEAELAAEDLRTTQSRLKDLLARDAVIVLDIGDQEAYEEGHLLGAMLVPLGALPGRIDALRAAKKAIVTYCR
jgi:SAM-dependent methyltransferase